jgi:hypothetical protein
MCTLQCVVGRKQGTLNLSGQNLWQGGHPEAVALGLSSGPLTPAHLEGYRCRPLQRFTACWSVQSFAPYTPPHSSHGHTNSFSLTALAQMAPSASRIATECSERRGWRVVGPSDSGRCWLRLDEYYRRVFQVPAPLECPFCSLCLMLVFQNSVSLRIHLVKKVLTLCTFKGLGGKKHSNSLTSKKASVKGGSRSTRSIACPRMHSRFNAPISKEKRF